MGSIGRYIFRTTFGAFLLVLVSLTTLIWITQALRDFDLMTNQGQTVLVFVGITGLIIPMLVMIIAPVALMIAVAHVLNKLGNDSEIIVMNAAGMAPWRLFRPFLLSRHPGLAAASPGSASTSRPKCLQELRRWATQVRAEIVTNNVQPGRFIVVDGKLTLHIRAREPNGQLRRHHGRRPARSEGTRHHPRRAGRDRQQRARHLPAAGERHRPAARSRASAIP